MVTSWWWTKSLDPRGGPKWCGRTEHHLRWLLEIGILLQPAPFGAHTQGRAGWTPVWPTLHTICLLSSLVENCNLRPTKEFESPCFIGTDSKDEVPRKASLWLSDVSNGSHADSGCVGLQNHLECEAVIWFMTSDLGLCMGGWVRM